MGERGFALSPVHAGTRLFIPTEGRTSARGSGTAAQMAAAAAAFAARVSGDLGRAQLDSFAASRNHYGLWLMIPNHFSLPTSMLGETSHDRNRLLLSRECWENLETEL